MSSHKPADSPSGPVSSHVSGASSGHEAFDPEPIRVLPDDEPKTPMWMPAAGVALFALGGLWLATAGGDESSPAASPSASASASAEAAPQLPPPTDPAVRPLPPMRPGPAGSANVDIERIRQRLLEQRRQGADGAPTPRPAPPRPLPAPPGAPGAGHE